MIVMKQIENVNQFPYFSGSLAEKIPKLFNIILKSSVSVFCYNIPGIGILKSRQSPSNKHNQRVSCRIMKRRLTRNERFQNCLVGYTIRRSHIFCIIIQFKVFRK